MALPSVRGHRGLKEAACPMGTALSPLLTGAFYLSHKALILILPLPGWLSYRTSQCPKVPNSDAVCMWTALGLFPGTGWVLGSCRGSCLLLLCLREWIDSSHVQ